MAPLYRFKTGPCSTVSGNQGAVITIGLRVDHSCHPSFRHHSPAPGQPCGSAGVTWFWSQLCGQFRGLQIVVNDLIAEGDYVVVRGTLHFHGPLGRFLEVVRVVDGQITDLWNILTFDRGWVEDDSLSRQQP